MIAPATESQPPNHIHRINGFSTSVSCTVFSGPPALGS